MSYGQHTLRCHLSYLQNKFIESFTLNEIDNLGESLSWMMGAVLKEIDKTWCDDEIFDATGNIGLIKQQKKTQYT